MGSFGVEPSADIRALASTMRQMFVALVDEGFTAGQAIQFLATWAGNTPPAPPDPDGRKDPE